MAIKRTMKLVHRVKWSTKNETKIVDGYVFNDTRRYFGIIIISETVSNKVTSCILDPIYFTKLSDAVEWADSAIKFDMFSSENWELRMKY